MMVSITATPELHPLRLPTAAEVREMLNDRVVWVVGIVAALILMLGLIAGIVILAVTGHATDALTNTFSGASLVTALMALNQIRSVKKTIEANGAATPVQ